MIKRIINWFSNSPVRPDRSGEFVDIVVKELGMTDNVSPEACNAVYEYSEKLAAEQQVGSVTRISADSSLSGADEAWRKKSAEALANQEAWRRHCNGSGR